MRLGERSRTKSEGKTWQAVERDIREALNIHAVAGQHETRHPAHVIDAHGDRRAFPLGQGRGRLQRGPVAGCRDFGFENQLVPLHWY